MTEYIFYQIVCNGKVYIGRTTDFDNRKCKHKYHCTNVKSAHYNLPVYQYIRANGNWCSCEMTIIEICNLNTKQDACMREEYWRIEKEATLNSNRCYLVKEEIKKNAKECVKKSYLKNKDKYNKQKKIKYYQQRLKNQMLIELLKS
jgi:hypothetical protein